MLQNFLHLNKGFSIKKSDDYKIMRCMKLYACKLKYNFVVDTPLLYNLIKKISTNPSKELTKKKNTLELKEN